jgi:hypothetical protein
MPAIFEPHGTLNVSDDPSSLPEKGGDGSILAQDMTRCKNLRLDQTAPRTRDGSSKLNASPLADTGIWQIIEQAGDRYTFAGDAIYKNESSIATGYTDAQWAGVLYNPFNSTTQSIYAVNGTDRVRIEGSNVYNMGITTPPQKPGASAGTGSGLTGDYSVKISYARKDGQTVVVESSPSEASSTITLADDGLYVTWNTPTDSQTTHVRVYRTTAGGSTYAHDQDVAVGRNYCTTNTPDGSLGAAPSSSYSRPGELTYIFGPNYNGYVFGVVGNKCYWCLPKQPDNWPSSYYLEVSPLQHALQTGVFYNGQPYVLSRNEIYYIQGTGTETYFPLRMNAITGAQGPQGACSVQGWGIFHIGSDGLYLFSEVDRNITQPNFQPIFRGETVNGVPGAGSLANAWVFQYRNQLWFGYPGASDTYPKNVLVWNLDNKRTSYYHYDNEVRTLCWDRTNDRLLAGDNSGYVWVLEDADQTTDDSTAISWEIESKSFTLPTRRHFPRWAKYDVDASSATTATGELILDGTSHQSHTLSSDRDTKRRLITTGNGKRCSVRVSGTGPVEIYSVEFE